LPKSTGEFDTANKHIVVIAGFVAAAVATVSQPVSAALITKTLSYQIGNFLHGWAASRRR